MPDRETPGVPSPEDDPSHSEMGELMRSSETIGEHYSEEELRDLLSELLQQREDGGDDPEVKRKIDIVRSALGTEASLSQAARSGDARHEEGALAAAEMRQEEASDANHPVSDPESQEHFEKRVNQELAHADSRTTRNVMESRQDAANVVGERGAALGKVYSRIHELARSQQGIPEELREKAVHDAEVIEFELTARLQNLLGVDLTSASRIADTLTRYDGPPEKLVTAAESIEKAQKRLDGILSMLEMT